MINKTIWAENNDKSPDKILIPKSKLFGSYVEEGRKIVKSYFDIHFNNFGDEIFEGYLKKVADSN